MNIKHYQLVEIIAKILDIPNTSGKKDLLSPDSFNSPRQAINLITGKIKEIYWHIPTLNIVLVDSKQKIGIMFSTLNSMPAHELIQHLREKQQIS